MSSRPAITTLGANKVLNDVPSRVKVTRDTARGMKFVRLPFVCGFRYNVDMMKILVRKFQAVILQVILFISEYSCWVLLFFSECFS